MAAEDLYGYVRKPGRVRERQAREAGAQLSDALELLDHAPGMYDAWTGMAFAEPPKDILGRLLWSAGVVVQMFVSAMTFPAALGAFLLEEAVQTYGMGAYMLSTAKAYETLDNYMPGWKSFIDSTTVGAKNLATVNPVTGGAVLIYMIAAKKSALAFEAANTTNMLREAERDETLRKKLVDAQKYGSLRLQSSPSQANIFINGEDTELLTPETFKEMDEGTYAFLLKKYSVARNVEETFEFTVNIEAGRKKEIYARIPKIINGTPEPGEDPDETDEPQLPTWIKANVTGEYAIDGDTFITTTGERIRVLAIDAPEIGRPWADVSKEALGLLIEDKSISLRIQSHKPLDLYGRTLAICSSYKGDIAVFQLSSGLARVAEFKDDLFDYGKYYNAEQVAKDRHIGIWS